jgi:hypothetical protein
MSTSSLLSSSVVGLTRIACDVKPGAAGADAGWALHKPAGKTLPKAMADARRTRNDIEDSPV